MYSIGISHSKSLLRIQMKICTIKYVIAFLERSLFVRENVASQRADKCVYASSTLFAAIKYIVDVFVQLGEMVHKQFGDDRYFGRNK